MIRTRSRRGRLPRRGEVPRSHNAMPPFVRLAIPIPRARGYGRPHVLPMSSFPAPRSTTPTTTKKNTAATPPLCTTKPRPAQKTDKKGIQGRVPRAFGYIVLFLLSVRRKDHDDNSGWYRTSCRETRGPSRRTPAVYHSTPAPSRREVSRQRRQNVLSCHPANPPPAPLPHGTRPATDKSP